MQANEFYMTGESYAGAPAATAASPAAPMIASHLIAAIMGNSLQQLLALHVQRAMVAVLAHAQCNSGCCLPQAAHGGALLSTAPPLQACMCR